MEHPNIKIKFEADYKAFAENSYLNWQTREDVSRTKLGKIIYSGFIAIVSVLPLLLLSAVSILISLMSFLLIFFLTNYLFSLPDKKSFFTKTFKVFGDKSFEVELRMSEEKFSYGFLNREYIYGLDEIKDVRELPDTIHILLSDENFIFVPKTAFETSSQLGQFLAFTKARIKEIDSK